MVNNGEFHGMTLGIYHLLMTDIAMENPPIYTMAIVQQGDSAMSINFGDPMSMKKIYIPSGPLVMTNSSPWNIPHKKWRFIAGKIPQQNMVRNMVLTYVHFRILKFPLIHGMNGLWAYIVVLLSIK